MNRSDDKSWVGLFIYVIALIVCIAMLDVRKEQLLQELNEKDDIIQQAYEDVEKYKAACEEMLAKVQYEYEVNEGLEMDLAQAQATVQDLKNEEYELMYMGEFKITYYCDERRNHICGGNGITASGKSTEVGVTAAADWSALPKGSMVYIEGVGYREIQDKGSAVKKNHIDVLVESHSEALSLGTKSEGVWLLVKKST